MNTAIEFLTLLTKNNISQILSTAVVFCYKQTDDVTDNKSLALPVEKNIISSKRKKEIKISRRCSFRISI